MRDEASARIWAYARPHLKELHPYVPGRQPEGDGWIKLNTNELPYPPSPRVAEAIAKEGSRLPKYPSPDSRALRAAIGELHGLAPESVFVGNGSDEVLALLVRAFAGRERPVGQTAPGYSLYPVLAAAEQAPVETVELTSDFSLPLAAISRLRASLFFLTSPNAPLGVGFPLEAIAKAAEAFDGIFVADEAYVDFAEGSAVSLLSKLSSLVVTRTFSKSYGLAGLRVGYALAHPTIIGILDRIRDSYNVNRLSQAGALAALRDQDGLHERVGRVKATRARVGRQLEEDGWEVLPSQTNFIFARPPAGTAEAAEAAFRHLESARILVRYFPGSPLTANGLRITIGTDSEMDRCLEELSAWLKHA